MIGNQQAVTGLSPAATTATAAYAANPGPYGENFKGTAKATAS
jgi:hypothetical protein